MRADQHVAEPLRVRFAPSPTGALHIGGARTALYNWLAGAGIGRDAGPPDRGHRPRALHPRERRADPRRAELARARLGRGADQPGRAGRPPPRAARGAARLRRRLPRHRDRRGRPRVPRGEPGPRLPRRARPTRRARRSACGSPTRARRSSTDAIRGEISFRNELQDDPVIARADGSVLYNFAVAVDDADMGITDVVRGDDHLSNTPRQLLVLAALGEPRAALRPPAAAPRPRRQEALQAPRRRLGPGAARGGLPARRRCATTWRCSAGAPRTTRRSCRPSELVERFSIDRVGRSSAIFDEAEAALAQRPLHARAGLERLRGRARRAPAAHRPGGRGARSPRRSGGAGAEACSIVREKAQTLTEVWPLIAFLFTDPPTDEKAWRKVMKPAVAEPLAELRARRSPRPSRSTPRRSSGTCAS